MLNRLCEGHDRQLADRTYSNLPNTVHHNSKSRNLENHRFYWRSQHISALKVLGPQYSRAQISGSGCGAWSNLFKWKDEYWKVMKEMKGIERIRSLRFVQLGVSDLFVPVDQQHASAALVWSQKCWEFEIRMWSGKWARQFIVCEHFIDCHFNTWARFMFFLLSMTIGVSLLL